MGGLRAGKKQQTILGVTGSGKTYTIASVLARYNKPVLVVSPNKVLAAQLYAEFKSFFPENAVEYFISYYDYYQPEAYIPQTDTYIEKDASINEHIERLRLKATASLLSRRDVIVVASVSCIYNIGEPAEFKAMCLALKAGESPGREFFTKQLILMQYERNDMELAPGRWRGRGGRVDIFPPYLEHPLRVFFEDDKIVRIEELHKITGDPLREHAKILIYPARHFVTSPSQLEGALAAIEIELNERVAEFKSQNKLLEAQRLLSRTRYDMAMMRSVGFCHGIENYSQHLSGRRSGERPFCLLDYFDKDFLLVVDESHVALPQFRGMYEGDRSRKQVLVEHGFRLPSALDNRPLKFVEFENLLNQVVYISATPGPYELSHSAGDVIELVVRPTGLVDPEIQIRPLKNQMQDLLSEIEKRVKLKERCLINTLTKRTAEDLSEYLARQGLRVRYLHSDIDPLQRIKILKDLRLGHFDALVGVNLLREGLDLPEVTLVAVLDADKEGFLRSETSLIQLCGRAARHLHGCVLLYADKRTGSMQRAIAEMDRRRQLQFLYNKTHNITPRTIVKEVRELSEFELAARERGINLVQSPLREPQDKKSARQIMRQLENEMREAADRLEFELAARLRDQIFELKGMLVKK